MIVTNTTEKPSQLKCHSEQLFSATGFIQIYTIKCYTGK